MDAISEVGVGRGAVGGGASPHRRTAAESTVQPTHRWLRGLRGRIAAALVLLVWSSACQAGDTGSRAGALPELDRVASSARVPPSQDDDITLLDRDRACLIDSYRVRVLCGGRSWEDPQPVGSEGEGPGEYLEPADLARGPGGSVAVVDYETSRTTLFRPGEEHLRTFRVPTAFRPIDHSGEGVWIGTYASFGDSAWAAPVAWISGSADSVLATRKYRYVSEATREAPAGGVSGAARAPDGGLVFLPGGGYRLARFSASGRYLDEFSSPEYKPELPSPRDVAEYREGLKELFGREPAEEKVRAYRNRPKLPYVRGEPLRFDSTGRLWVATTRDHEERSWFDLFQDGEFLGSVPVEDRVVGFDILGSTLAVLVEGTEKDSAGLYPRRIDWYRIQD